VVAIDDEGSKAHPIIKVDSTSPRLRITQFARRGASRHDLFLVRCPCFRGRAARPGDTKNTGERDEEAHHEKTQTHLRVGWHAPISLTAPCAGAKAQPGSGSPA